jgi:hypothetical protein
MTYQPIALDADTQWKIACAFDDCRGADSWCISEHLREWAMTNQNGRYNFEDYAVYIYAEFGIRLDH